MRRSILLTFLALLSLSHGIAAADTIEVKLIATTDIHGCFLPYDFMRQCEAAGSMARASTYINKVRASYGSRLLLLDGGDILQGQPLVYYYNYVAPEEENIAAAVTNYLGYDLQTYGNHDIETGHAIYDKWAAETRAPIVCANLIDDSTGQPYAPPYYLFERQGLRIAVIGLLTTATPCWISEEKYRGLHFEDAATAAERWVKYVREVERADVVVGLFHSGLRGGIHDGPYEENATERIAREVDGFDAILFGHDHTVCCTTITNNYGREVWLLNPANAVHNVAELTISALCGDEGIDSITYAGRIVDVCSMPIDDTFVQHFSDALERVKEYTSQTVGILADTLYTREAYVGSSAYTDLIHYVQLWQTGADLSFCAPLQYDTTIPAGVLTGADMFTIYKYENRLCTVELTGKEIKDYLEMSYALWTNTMDSPSDHILNIKEYMRGDDRWYGFVHPTFNFDSAKGIDYEVDVTRPQGEKIHILRMSNGTPFSEEETYRVAMNSYRANNGGELLSKGAGIAKSDIPQRITWESTSDIRFYIMQYIECQQTYTPSTDANWHFVPAVYAAPAIARDEVLLFGGGQ